jgi:hypothetical protein
MSSSASSEALQRRTASSLRGRPPSIRRRTLLPAVLQMPGEACSVALDTSARASRVDLESFLNHLNASCMQGRLQNTCRGGFREEETPTIGVKHIFGEEVNECRMIYQNRCFFVTALEARNQMAASGHVWPIRRCQRGSPTALYVVGVCFNRIGTERRRG